MKLWFKAKNYGWGWYPSSWEGWLILLIYLILIMVASKLIAINLYLYLSFCFIITAILIFICYKTGEKPYFRWGKN
jgi:uncharacterized membrane protein YhaH (DUF805 family)